MRTAAERGETGMVGGKGLAAAAHFSSLACKPKSSLQPAHKVGTDSFYSFHSNEYVYDRAAVAALEGPALSRLRRNISQYLSNSDAVVREYTKDDQRACMALRKKWYDHMISKGVTISSYHKYTAACLEQFGKFSNDLLSGQVIEIDGSVRAFSFGGQISKLYGSVFITISDHDWPSLAYLQRYKLMSSFPQLAYFNDALDNRRPGLAQMKRAFRPVEMHGIYSARER